MVVKSQDKKHEIEYDEYLWGISIGPNVKIRGWKFGLIVATNIKTFKRINMAAFEDEDEARAALRDIRKKAGEKKKSYSFKRHYLPAPYRKN